jgi:dihydrofolate reductase
MKLIIIAALAENRVIGKDNDLVWRLPKDFQNFKRVTMGHPMIMGRKTFESLKGALPGRTLIIITRDRHYQAEGCIVVHTLEEAIRRAAALDDEIYIAGGAEIYRMAMPLTDIMYLTHVKASPEGDTYFPEFSQNEWKETSRQFFDADEKNQYAFDIVTWERIK